MRANEPWGVANLNPGGMVSRIYVCDHLSLLHIKYLRPMVSMIFEVFTVSLLFKFVQL